MSRTNRLESGNQRLWDQLPSGLVVPNGERGRSLEWETQSFVEIKELAEQVERMYESSGIPLNRSSSLYSLIQSAKALSEAWLVGQAERVPEGTLFSVCHAFRISQAILSLNHEPNASGHLAKLASGDLNLLDRKQSSAKDFLWEVEMFHTFKRKGLSPQFEEPDLTILINGARVSVACKKIYSEKRLQSSLSTAVKQIQLTKRPGIVAINLDDLHPANSILGRKDAASINEALSASNLRFIKSHDHHLRRYFESSRISACIVSTSLIGDALKGFPRINNFSEMTCWVIPNIGKERQRIADGLSKIMSPDSPDRMSS